jgi:peptide/nickel transport system permease protein
MFQAPLLAVYPGVAIMLSVLGLNLMGDGLRDLMDPKLARQR